MIKYFLSALPIIFLAGTLQAQEIKVKFNHNALMVKDLEEASNFYQNILGLQVIDNPTGNPGIRWFSMGNGLQLHLITGDTKDVSINKTIHTALSLAGFGAFIERLDSNNIPYSSWDGEPGVVTVRPDGVRQVYVQDPDGYWIEINDEI